MPSAIQIISKLILLKLKIPPGGLNPVGYSIEPSKKDPKRPRSWAGNFAVVVPGLPDQDGGGKSALRFFLAKTPSHMTQITSFINRNPHTSLVKCKIYRDFLVLKNETVDMMEMDFVEGETLDEFVDSLIHDGKHASLCNLAESIRSTVNELVDIGFYHGDLSHSNVMFSHDGAAAYDTDPGLFKKNLRLIDYDSVLISGIQNPPETKETGHPNFQHPSRRSNRFTVLEDVYFSTLVIYLSLVALSYNPTLWEKHHSKGDNILFQHQQKDLHDSNSELWKELDAIRFAGEHVNAYECLKKAIDYNDLQQSPFLSEIETWFTQGTTPTPAPIPHPGSGSGLKPQPNHSQTDRPAESPKPRKRVSNGPQRSPTVRKRSSPSTPRESPKPRKKTATSTKTQDGKSDPQKNDETQKPQRRERKKKTEVGQAQAKRPKLKQEIKKRYAKKRKPKTLPVEPSDLKDYPLVLDGTNILYEMKNGKDISLTPFLEFCTTLSANSDNVIVVFDASTRHKFTDEDDVIRFVELVDGNEKLNNIEFSQSPKATEADSIVLSVAYEKKGIVIGNDFYQDYEERIPDQYAWFQQHHITFSFVAGTCNMNTSSKNKFLD